MGSMSEGAGTIEVISRAVVTDSHKVLLCHTRGAWNTYLPGGHVEFGEPAGVALARELKEELGVDAEVRGFLGGIEHCYKRDRETCCEINLVFEAVVPSLSSISNPLSMEDYIEFIWADINDLEAQKVQPDVLAQCLGGWLSGETLAARWISSGLLT